MDRLSLKSRLSLNSSPLHSSGSIFPTVLEEPNLSFSDHQATLEATYIGDTYNESGRQQSGKPQQQHKSRRRLPLLTTAFRKHCSRSFDSGISYLLNDSEGVAAPPMDESVISEEVEPEILSRDNSIHEPSSPRHLVSFKMQQVLYIFSVLMAKTVDQRFVAN